MFMTRTFSNVSDRLAARGGADDEPPPHPASSNNASSHARNGIGGSTGRESNENDAWKTEDWVASGHDVMIAESR